MTRSKAQGIRLSWFVRWGIEQKIDGYGIWCLGRSWVSHFVDDFEQKGYSRNLVTRAIMELKRDTDVGYYDAKKIQEWLDRNQNNSKLAEDIPEQLTTFQVVQKVVIPATKEKQNTYVELIESQNKSNPTHFVSHSWSYPIWSLIEGLVMHQLNCDRSVLYTLSLDNILRKLDSIENPNYYWVDIFNKNQHIVNSEGTIVELAESIRKPGKTVLILHPTDKWALNRVWCLFEVLNTIQLRATLDVGLSFRFVDLIEHERINDLNDKKEIPWNDLKRYQMLQKLDVRTADATVAADKEMIFKQVQESIGFEHMNDMVYNAIVESFGVVQKGLYVERSD